MSNSLKFGPKQRKNKFWTRPIQPKILKNISTQNQPIIPCTPHRITYICDHKIEVWYGDGFGQTEPESVMLKITQNCTKPLAQLVKSLIIE